MEKELSLLDIFKALKDRYLIIILTIIIFIISSAGISFFLDETLYESTATLTFGVESSQDTEEINQITGEPIQETYIRFGTNSVNKESLHFYKELLGSKDLLEEVITNLDLDMTNKELSDSIFLENPEESGTLHLIVQSKTSKNTDKIADEVVSVFKEKNLEITGLDNLKTLNPATEPIEVHTQNMKLNILLAAIIGLTIGILLVIILEFIQ